MAHLASEVAESRTEIMARVHAAIDRVYAAEGSDGAQDALQELVEAVAVLDSGAWESA